MKCEVGILLDKQELEGGLVICVDKASNTAVECRLSWSTDEGLLAVGKLTVIDTSEAPNVSIVICLPHEMPQEPDLESMVRTILDLLGKPEDETHQAVLYRFDPRATAFASRRANSRQPSPWI